MCNVGIAVKKSLLGVGIIAAGGSLIEMALTQLVINIRYSLMGISLSQKLDGSFNTMHRMIASFGITDEIFAVAVTNTQPVTRNYLLGLMTLPYLGWTGGTLLGAILGGVLPPVIVSALNIALYAMFIAIVIPTAMQNLKVLPVIFISVGLSCAFTFIPFLQSVNSGIVYVISALVASVIGALIFPIYDADDENEDNISATYDDVLKKESELRWLKT